VTFHQENLMAKAPDNQGGKAPQGKKSPDPKSPPKQGQPGRKDSAAKQGERPIADVDRKVRGGDA
jgi:hypothetical protein